VKSHVGRSCPKLGLRGRVRVVVLGCEAGLIQPAVARRPAGQARFLLKLNRATSSAKVAMSWSFQPLSHSARRSRMACAGLDTRLPP
jgi:hypothetical protein